LREVLTEEACQDVEVIGWLYQYYISERKDEVFEAWKKNQKIEAKDIPAATQLFTPHWIVRYLVENSLGRLWLLNKPDSKLAEKIEYYIKPVDVEKDYLKVNSPEELKICDPACGSGHMLTYAFDLLYTIYEEEGYEPVSISSLILQKNLFGIEIDGRAGALAAFALFMKARSKDKRFFTRNIQPNVCVLENVSFSDQELKEYISAMGRDLFTEPLLETLKQFEQADNFGSLIRPILTNPEYVRQSLEQKNLAGNIFLFGIHERVLKVLKQSEYLSPLFHVVITNPPYMEISSANSELKDFAQDLYPNSKADLFAMFLERDFILSLPKGFIGMITMQSWMFLSSFTELREIILTTKRLLTMAHLGARAFDSISGEVVATTSFVIANSFQNNKYVDFINLTDGKSEKEKAVLLKDTISSKLEHRLFHKPLSDFEKIPGKPFSYWASILSIDNFVKGEPLQLITQDSFDIGLKFR
jgi:type II restriction/modification system DNA methylase subunit YeeA